MVVTNTFSLIVVGFSLCLLGAFAKLRKATISIVTYIRPSVRLFVRMEQLYSYWTDFDE